MLTSTQIHEIVRSLASRQADRLFKSGLTFDTFMNRPEELAVTYEITCYDNLLAGMEPQMTH